MRALPPELEMLDATRVLARGRRLAYFGGSDYLRLSWHPEVRAAAVAGVKQFGPCTCASRLTTGNVAVYGRLEGALEEFFGSGHATLTSAGYAAPMVAAQALADRHTHVVLDKRAHGCLRDAAAVTGLPIVEYAHACPKSFGEVAARLGRTARLLVLTEGLITPRGEVAPIGELLESLRKGSTLLVDDAHGVGVVGTRGRGSVEAAGVGFGRVVLTFTLSKGFGCYGGGVLGPKWLREAILAGSGMFSGNTPLPPPLACAALAAVGVMQREGEERRARLRERLAWVRGQAPWLLDAAGLRPGPMFAVVPGSRSEAQRLRAGLLAGGVYPSLIRYPNGPAPEYYRFAVSSEHSEAQVNALVRALAITEPK